MKASYPGVFIDGQLLFPRISTFNTDQPEERDLLALTGRGSDMDCSISTVPSRALQRKQDLSNSLSSSDDEDDAISVTTLYRGLIRNRTPRCLLNFIPKGLVHRQCDFNY